MYHVIWTTIGFWLPNEQRGNWNSLKNFYQELGKENHHFTAIFSDRYSDQPQKQNREIRLGIDEQKKVEEILRGLCQTDRVAEGTQILALHVTFNKVEMLIRIQEKELTQVVGRLKSRSATIAIWSLGDSNLKRIWSKGFWIAEIEDKDAIDKVIEYIERESRTS